MQRAAIITGSSRGIGKAVALRLAKDGFAVTVNYAGSKDAAEETLKEIKVSGGKAILVQGDVSNKDDVRRLFDETEKAFGGLDVLINNAGVMGLKPIAEIDDEMHRRIFAINVDGTFFAMREAATRLREGGRIINFSSTANRLNMPRYALYCATKAAVETYTVILAKELSGKKITVNAVAPGPVDTELFWEDKTKEMVQGIVNMTPLGRLGKPEDVANVISFLVGDQGAWINGQIIRANGGLA